MPFYIYINKGRDIKYNTFSRVVQRILLSPELAKQFFIQCRGSIYIENIGYVLKKNLLN